MRTGWVASIMLAASIVTACTPSETRTPDLVSTEAIATPAADKPEPSNSVQRVDKNLQCAAMISASAFVIAEGKVELPEKTLPRTVYAGQLYINAYADKTNQMSRDASKEVNALRDSLMASLKPKTIVSRARKCISRAPGPR